MATYIYSIILLIIALVCIDLRKSYHTIPKAELRRRAQEGDELFKRLYRANSYGQSLEILLWLIIILCAAGSIVLFYRIAPLWVDFIAVALFIWLAFAWLPKRRMDAISNQLAYYLTPPIVWILNYIHPTFKKINKLSSKALATHTGIYDKKDLIKFLDNQKHQSDSRIDPSELELIKKVLKLSDKTVGDYCKSWSKIHHAQAHEVIGPILLDELHKSKQLFIPVVEDNQTKNVVGMIDINHLDIARAGEVKDLMNQNVLFLNEADTLKDALDAMATTAQPVFIVLDKKQRVFGMITLKEVINQLISLESQNKSYSNKEEKLQTAQMA